MGKKKEPWTKEDFEKFKALVCDEVICPDCSGCDRNDVDILECFDDLTSDPYPGSN